MLNNNNNKKKKNTSSYSPPGPVPLFPAGAIWRIWRDWIIESTLKHTHTAHILQAFWWENSKGSASLPKWRSYILNQIHVCFVCVSVCVHLCFFPSPSQYLFRLLPRLSSSQMYTIFTLLIRHTLAPLLCLLLCGLSLPHCKKWKEISAITNKLLTHTQASIRNKSCFSTRVQAI